MYANLFLKISEQNTETAAYYIMLKQDAMKISLTDNHP